MNYVIKVVDLESGDIVPFAIDIPLSERQQDVVYGRARWTPDGEGIVYVGQGADGSSGIFVQDFVPDGDTRSTRRAVAGFSEAYSTESLGISPDGTRLVVSTIFTQRKLQMADQLELKNWR